MRKTLYSKILDYDISILLIFLFIFCVGIFSFFTLKVSFLPRHSEPVLTIITDYHGMEPEIIEEIITRPIEGLLKEIKGIKTFYSYSSKGRSKIIVYLHLDEDVDEKAVLINDAIHHISDKFPAEVRQPGVYKYNTDDRPLMIFSLYSSRYSDDELYRITEQRIKPELLSMQGIANVEIAGSFRKEYFIEQKYENLIRLNGNYESIFEDIVHNNASVPPGNLKLFGSLIPVTFPNKYKDLMSLPQWSFNVNENIVFGYELFSVKRKNREDNRVSLINNRNALTLYVFKRDFSNILEIDRGVQRIMNKWKGLVEYKNIYNQAERFKNLLRQLEIGVCFSVLCVFCIILLFYRKLSLVFLIIITVPVSFAGTAVVLKLFSRSLNIMTLSGLIVGIGTCVDNTIIMIETTRLNIKGSTAEAAVSSSMEKVNRPILSSTLTTIIVFLPLFYINRSRVSLYVDFALAVSSMLVISYFVSLFFVPAFIRRFYGAGNVVEAIAWRGKRRFIKKDKKKYFRKSLFSFPLYIVNKVFQYPVLSACIFFITAGGFCYLFITLEYEEVSPLKENTFELYYEFDPRYNTAYKKEVIKEIGDEILALNLPVTLVSKLEDTRATFFLKFSARDKSFKPRVQKVKEYFSKVEREDGFFYFQKGKEAGVKSVILYFFGDNLDKLDSFVDNVSGHIAGFYGTRQVLKGYREGKPEIIVNVDPERLRYYNLNASDVIRFLRYIFYYPVIMKYFDGENIIDVRGRIKTGQLQKGNIHLIRVPVESGQYVSISDFATVGFSDNPGTISRKNGKRYISLDIRYEEVKEDVFLDKLETFLKGTGFEGDFYYEFDEKLIEKKNTRAVFIFTICLSVFLIYVVLGIVLKSFKYPFLILLEIPSLFIGSFLFLRICGYGQCVPAHIALIMLTGLSVNSTILLLEEVLRFRKRGIKKALLIGYSRKLRLIGMTMFTTVFSVIPVFLLATSTYFFKILTGIIFSGMVSALIVSLLIFPAFYIFFHEKSATSQKDFNILGTMSPGNASGHTKDEYEYFYKMW